MPHTALLLSALRVRLFCFALFVLAVIPLLSAQSTPQYYARGNSFGILFAYSPDSNHILLGDAEQRKILNLGVSYSRRLLIGHIVNWQYDAEIMPVALESDPLTKIVVTQTSPSTGSITVAGQPPMVWCAPTPYSYSFTDNNGVVYAGTQVDTCHGRQWTIGQAMSPAGMQWNFLPSRRLQPFLVGHGGYMFSTHAIPVLYAGAFNFTFDFGAGLEWYRTRTQSIRVQYRYHHISDDDTSEINPGIDNGVFQVSYVFGR